MPPFRVGGGVEDMRPRCGGALSIVLLLFSFLFQFVVSLAVFDFDALVLCLLGKAVHATHDADSYY
jgi:hypothetical protein